MPRFATFAIAEVLVERPGLQRVALDDGSRAYVLTGLIGPAAVGDRVVVNTTAVDLGLGTGGWHVVHWNLSRVEWSTPGAGHVLKLRYTSLQTDVGVAEEARPDLPAGLGGAPVVVCDLHSQVGVVATAFAATAPGEALAYVMTDSAALPVALSDLVADLRERGLLATTVTAGQAFGGDHEAVNIYSGLLVARAAAHAIVIGPGPGSVGTGSRLGYGSLDALSAIDAAIQLGGHPVVAVRYSGADARPRHRELSHHTRTVLALASGTVTVPYPAGQDAHGLLPERHRVTEVDVPDLDVAHTTMGRGQDEDPEFFRWSAAAGVLAARLVNPGEP